MRQAGGTVLVACGLVHLDPSWINLLLRELLDHRLADPAQASWWKRQLAEYCRRNGSRFPELIAIHKNFLRTGRLTKDYLQFLWREVPGLANAEVFGRMISTMSTYGAMFQCDPSLSNAMELLLPARLPATVGDDTLTELKSAILSGIRMQFVIEIYAKYIPPGIIAQFLGGFCRDRRIIFRACWNRGAAFIMDGREHLVCLHEPTGDLDARVEVNVAGSTRETVSNHGFAVMEALCTLLTDRYRGLLFDPSCDPQFMSGQEAWDESLAALERHLKVRMDEVRQVQFRLCW